MIQFPWKYRLLYLILLLSISYYFTVRYLSRDRPAVYFDDFHVSSLNKTSYSPSNPSTNTTRIYFDLKIKNQNSGVGVYYDDPLTLTFTYFQPAITTTTSIIIGQYTIQGYYQGNGKVKHIQDFVVVPDLFTTQVQAGVDLQTRRKLGETYLYVMGPTKVVEMKVDLDAKIKFKSIENKKSHLVAGALVEVNGDTGDLLLRKTLQLEYGSGSDKWGVMQWLLFFPLLILFVLTFVACVFVLIYVPSLIYTLYIMFVPPNYGLLDTIRMYRQGF